MATATAPALEIFLLGPIEVAYAGNPLTIGGPRQRALLALLALDAGRIVAADRLIDEIWAGEPPQGAEISLRTYILRLRRSLGDHAPIRAAAPGYSLDVPPESIDARRFERLVREAQAAFGRRNPRRAANTLRGALALWRGDPLGGTDSGGALQFAAERLRELRLTALELRVEADLESGRATELVDELEGLVREHPYRETLWRQLMLALYRAERQADALAAYHRARSALDEQLGLEPGADLKALEAAILRHEVAAVRPPAAQNTLPAPISSLIGRSAELADVGALLESNRLVTLTGVGGVGKTRLGIEAARARMGDLDSVFFIDLAALADPELVAGHVGVALEVREQPGIAPIERLIDHLRTLEALIVLDNCEHLRDACAELASQLLSACPRLRILATSREVLGVPGELDYPVPPMALPASPDDVRAVERSEAVQLFLARAREARPGLPIDEATLTTVAQICVDLDGLPLGIEFAAARVRALSPPEIAARLADRFRFLVSWRRLTPARHRTLREAMDWSYELLDGDAQALLPCLSVFAGGFTLQAAADVCLGGDTERALALLERLVDASLVVVVPRTEGSRYRLLETVRQYGADRLEETGEAAALRDRHAAHFASVAGATNGRVALDGAQVLTTLVPDDANLRAALRHFETEGSPENQLELVADLWHYWWLRGFIAEGRDRVKAALERAPGATRERAKVLRGASTLALRQGDLRTALAYAEESVQLAGSIDDLTLAGAKVALANVVGSLGELDEAHRLYAESADRFRSGDQPWWLANALMNMADHALNRGDIDAAERLARESLQLSRETGDAVAIGINLGNLGFAALERGHAKDARELFAEGLQHAQRAGFGEFAAMMLVGLASVVSHAGADHEAATILGAADALLDQAGASLESIEGRTRDRTASSLDSRLGHEAFAASREAGRALGATQAAQLARTVRMEPHPIT